MKRIAVLMVLAVRVAAADPWVDPTPGHGTFFFGFSDTRADQYFAGSQPAQQPQLQFPPPSLRAGQLYPITVPVSNGGFEPSTLRSTYSTQTLLMTGDLSLGKHFAFAFSAPMLKNVSEHAEGAGTASFLGWGDLILGVKYELPFPKGVRGFAFGPQLFLTTPTGNQNARARLSHVVASDNAPVPLQTGNGTVDLEARLSAGYDFHPIPVFVVAELGYHHHFDTQETKAAFTSATLTHVRTSYSDDLPYRVRIGGRLALHRRGFHHGTLSLDLSGVRSLNNGTKSPYGSPFLDYAGQFNNATSFSMGASVSWFPVRWVGLSYSISHVLSGENTGSFLTNTIGIVSEF